MNRLDLAEALITVADTGTIQEAADKLHQTSAAISKKLTKLEEYLSTQLLIRHRKGITLTEAGQRYYHEMKKAIEQFKIAESSASHAKICPKGKLKVVLSYLYAETIVIPKLAAFLKKYPDIYLELEFAEVLPNFNVKKMDIIFSAVNPSEFSEQNIVRKAICSTRFILCASPLYLKNRKIPHSLPELLQHDFIIHSARKPKNVILFDDNQKLEVNSILELNNTPLMIKTALEGIGIIWTHESLALPYVKKKLLVRILDQYTQQKSTVYMCYVYQKYPDAKIEAFVEFFSP